MANQDQGMRVLIAPDSFKGSLRADRVARIIARELESVLGATTSELPLADGGEGTAEILTTVKRGQLIRERVTDPLGRPVEARWGRLDNETAVVEMAEASGLHLVERDERDPLRATTYGTGELIRAALERGAQRILIGIGGSATVDGGAGMAQALGVRLVGETGEEVGYGGGVLDQVAEIDISELDSRVHGTEFLVASDVTNPLDGDAGVAVYMPQKGATPEMVERLKRNLGHFADRVEAAVGISVRDRPGAGAAGGLGFGLMAFLNAELRPGIELFLEELDFESQLDGCDLVISGEGRVDAQTAYGKVVAGVARLAKRHGKPLIVLAGARDGELDELYQLGVTAIIDIIPRPMGVVEAMAEAETFLRMAAREVGYILKLGVNRPEAQRPVD